MAFPRSAFFIAALEHRNYTEIISSRSIAVFKPPEKGRPGVKPIQHPDSLIEVNKITNQIKIRDDSGSRFIPKPILMRLYNEGVIVTARRQWPKNEARVKRFELKYLRGIRRGNETEDEAKDVARKRSELSPE